MANLIDLRMDLVAERRLLRMIGMNSNSPLISVIVPVYNVEKYLRQCIDSIIHQTYSNLEIILVDDGSFDNCPEICDEYQQKDQRILAIHQTNQGQSAARNVALNNCKGDIISFVDSDDWLELNAFEILVEALQVHDCDIAFMAANRIYDSEVKPDFFFYPDGTVCSVEHIIHRTLRDEIGGQPCLKIYRRNCWEGISFPEGRIYEDLAISFLPFVNAKKDVVFIGKPLYNYRMNINGTSLSFNPKRTYNIFLGFKDHYEYAQKFYPEDSTVCLAKATRFALGTIHESLRYPSESTFKYALEADDFIQKHRGQIMQSIETFSVKYKILISVYLLSVPLYTFVGKIFSWLFKKNK